MNRSSALVARRTNLQKEPSASIRSFPRHPRFEPPSGVASGAACVSPSHDDRECPRLDPDLETRSVRDQLPVCDEAVWALELHRCVGRA